MLLSSTLCGVVLSVSSHAAVVYTAWCGVVCVYHVAVVYTAWCCVVFSRPLWACGMVKEMPAPSGQKKYVSPLPLTFSACSQARGHFPALLYPWLIVCINWGLSEVELYSYTN